MRTRNETGSGSCPMAGFGISSVEPLGSCMKVSTSRDNIMWEC
jgi:hypothetical protein